MTAIQFPLSKIDPIEDLAERAIQRVCEVESDFLIEIAAAQSVDRALQLRERLAVCVTCLLAAEDAALQRADALTNVSRR